MSSVFGKIGECAVQGHNFIEIKEDLRLFPKNALV